MTASTQARISRGPGYLAGADASPRLRELVGTGPTPESVSGRRQNGRAKHVAAAQRYLPTSQ